MRAVVAVIGKDTVGILAKVSGICAEYGANVMDVTQTIMQDLFAMTMLIEISKISIDYIDLAEKLKNAPVKVSARAGANGKLFGAVTSKEVSDALKEQHGIDLAKQKIVMDEPIKAYGSYELKAKLGYEVSGTIYVMVVEGK